MTSIELTLPNGVKYTQPTGLFINNEFVPSKAGGTIESINPSTAKPICSVFAGDETDVDIAVAAAKKAYKSWKKVTPTERGAILYKFADLAEKNFDLLTAVEAFDAGKPAKQNSANDVTELINVFRYYAGYADKVSGRTISSTSEKFAYTVREPLGVCGQVIPWNFPLLMAAWKIAPALAAGNTVVMKPSEFTPLSILVLMTFAAEAGVPAGVLNVVNGLGSIAGAALVSHPDVAKVAFTGSTATGKRIMQTAAGTLKKVTLECGGKSPLIIFDDADLDSAVMWAHIGIMYNSGQVCTSTSRLYVHEKVYDEFCTKFVEHVKKASVIGDVFDDSTFHGPQVSKPQFDKIMSYIDIGKKEGATVALGGEAIDREGYFIYPTVFTHVNDNMRIVKEEIFGPVVAIGSFTSEEDVIERCNASEYGLGAAVFSKDVARAHRVSGELEAGMVWINSSNDSDFRIPFGGYKLSGMGRELGIEGIDNYTQVKAVHVNIAK
ncbi:hypothetical protein CANCADRAFT_1594 [Tortispora caseinolytica NRRL Y-17796]|uniref:Aldehyde dehydrogenase domain-containing protein n=1 Tax=Tortispora caseinolytica NRRL Y-17796 TaxID=767744 RepID=A0A1E4TDP1_9ASCO|nr:hypothetical protein CANCADRAFT_1594 [Tortispora caseinolytica NRRL Y-17796]